MVSSKGFPKYMHTKFTKTKRIERGFLLFTLLVVDKYAIPLMSGSRENVLVVARVFFFFFYLVKEEMYCQKSV
ncbi:hypothetical protein HanXRQr2_Chr06g0246591 [Helianthus annuus]|uniref:Uncharacterized protein n=1 Tax=Helianthus annuus TaxID=4232 RepID=A0A9K3NI48_HELAN|nr:hypothetical protein HanXRQr2_Chr06g0246591 [Helianthus annuus]